MRAHTAVQAAAAAVVVVFCCVGDVRAQTDTSKARISRPPVSAARGLVSLTAVPGQVLNGRYTHVQSPRFTVTFDRTLSGGPVERVWITSSAPDILLPPAMQKDELGQPVQGPNNFVLVASNTTTTTFGLEINPAVLTAPRQVTLTAAYGSSRASTILTITIPPPNPVVSLTVTPAELANGVYQGNASPQFTVTLAETVANTALAAEKVWITSSDPALVAPPRATKDETGGPVSGPDNFILVLNGKKSAVFGASVAFDERLTTAKRVTVTARNNSAKLSTTVTITPLPAYHVTSVQVSPSSFRVGQSAQYPVMTVALDRAVTPPPGFAFAQYTQKVWVASSAPDVADALLIEVRQGSSSATGMVDIKAVGLSSFAAPRDVTFSAGAGPERATTEVQATAALHVAPILLKTFRLSSQPVQPLYVGTLDDGVGTLEIDYPSMVMDVDVNLISMEPDVVNFSRNYESSPSPHYGKILKGMAGTNFHVFAMPVQMRKTYIGEDRQVTIAAEYRGQRMTAVVPVIWPRAISSLVISPPNQGGVNMATLTLDRPAPAGGITLAINTSNRPGFLNLPNTVRVEAGQTTGTFSLSLKPPYGAQAGVTVTVTAVPYWNSSVTSPVPVH